MTRQATNFQRKLTQIRETSTEDHHRMMEDDAESFFQLNSVEYLDFPDVHKQN